MFSSFFKNFYQLFVYRKQEGFTMDRLYMPIQKCKAGQDISTLSDIELLAILLGTGSKGIDVISLATEVMKKYGNIERLYQCGIHDLASFSGIGLTKAIRVMSGLELGKRIIGKNLDSQAIDTPWKVWQLLLPNIAGLKNEEFTLLCLNNKNHLIRKQTLFKGTLSETIVHPREIFKEAVRESAGGIIVAHNHPSGILDPSKEDIHLTRRLTESGRIMGIPLLDHVILGEHGFLSLQEKGYIV